MLTLKSISVGMGFLFIIIYLPFVFNYAGWKRTLTSIVNDDKMARVYGVIMLLISFLILSVNHTFEKAWPVAISVLGWLLLLKGLFWFWFPGLCKKMADKMMRTSEWLIVISGLLGLAVGVFFEYLGFYIF